MSFYFIAIPLPDRLKKKLSNWQSKYKPLLPYKHWTDRNDFHITLKFLGEVDQEKLHLLQKKLVELKYMQRFTVNVHSLNTFGNPYKPRVLWIGVDKNKEIMAMH